ncbi:UDP-N-acetylglucosamine transferase subunit ALG13 homolog [Diorhabda sublineata]|uniref:UDP-N-acetylglucosamine transferase subunit ALG13 homolog n=1 Tax=Diorhabda sublineata TaxID=1163346 RepID=UPI0024E1493B|nr:UDP-N-acetylglucosamine transferase subunit ALG13 homolog [Diorhabda sublineata]
MIMGKNIFVTVGTTKFPKLLDTIIKNELLRTFIKLGYDFIQIQTGKDIYKPPDAISREITKVGDSMVLKLDKITIKYDSYIENFEEEILKSDFVISHAGAGTCLEVLKAKKPLLVVINEDLMNNHQIELAEELQNNGYLYYSTCDSLINVLEKDFSALTVYPNPDTLAFSEYLNKSMGYV